MARMMFCPSVWKSMATRFIAGLLAIALFGMTHTTAAQALKRYVTPDGKTIYSDTPVPGAKLVGEVAPPPPRSAPDAAALQREKERADQANRAISERLSAQETERKRIEDASAKLEQAKRTLEQGRTPKAGERIGTAGGGSRFTEEYLARQRANEDAVKRAEDELRKARGR